MTIEQLKKGYFRAFEMIIIFITGIMSINTGLNVVCRYIFNRSIVWSEELAGYLLVWLTLMGAILALDRKQHIGFNWLINKLSVRERYFFEIIGYFFLATFFIVLSYYGTILVIRVWDDRAVTFNLSKGIVYLVVPLSGIFMFIIIVFQCINNVRKYFYMKMR